MKILKCLKHWIRLGLTVEVGYTEDVDEDINIKG